MEVDVPFGRAEHILDVDRHRLAHILNHLAELVHAVEVLIPAMQLLVELSLDKRPDCLHWVEGTAVWRHHFRLEMLLQQGPYFMGPMGRMTVHYQDGLVLGVGVENGLC